MSAETPKAADESPPIGSAESSPEANYQARVFISYASRDVAVADAVVATLERHGVACWIAPRDVKAGALYAEAIVRAISDAKALVLVLSVNSVASAHVGKEVERASSKRRPVIALRIDDAPLSPALEYFLGESHWVDARAAGMDVALAKLIAATGEPERNAPGINPPVVAGTSAGTASAPPPKSRRNRNLLVAGLAVVAVVLYALLADRFWSAKYIVAEQSTTASKSMTSDKSIAVLPFTDMTGTGDQDYFVDGMMEEIAGALSRFRSLFVIASGSTMAFKGKAVAPREAARQLGVRYVLEGSVRKAASRVRIAVKLIDADDGAQIWGDRFEDTLEDVFALQDKVALSVAGVLEPVVREAEIRRVAQRPTANMGGYDLYLRALAVLRSYVWSDVFEAIRLAEQAIALDPNFGLALSLASRCHYLVLLYGWSDDPEIHRGEALAFSRRAVRAAADDASVLANTAMLTAYLEHELDTAIALAERACALNPGAAAAWYASGAVRILAGQLELAVEHLETSMRLNPIGPERVGGMLFLAMARFQQRRFADAIVLANELYQHFENPTGCAILAASYGHLRQGAAARDALDHYRRLSPQPIETYARSVWPKDDHLELFLDGIALAEGLSAV